MSVESGMSENHDRAGSKNYQLSVTHGEPGNNVKGTAFVNSLTEGGAYKSVGGVLSVEKSVGPHTVGANAFVAQSTPPNHPSFVTTGGGADYMYKNTVGASASVAHTPMFKQTDYGVGAKVNLHQTPTSTMSLNLGANKTVTPHHNGSFQPNIMFHLQKKF